MPPTDQPPSSETPPEPTTADAVEIAKAVVSEMQRVQEAGGSREEAEQAASTEIQRQLEISESDADLIAESVIKGLDSRGVFETQEPPPPPAGAPPAAPQEPAETEPAAGEPGGGEQPAAEQPPEPAPRRPTFAERFVGKK